MTLILFGLVILSGVFLFKSYVNKYSSLFTLMLWSLIVAIYLILMYTVKASIYAESGSFFVNVDNLSRTFTIRHAVSEYSIIRVFNLCCVVYLFSQPLFVRAYISDKKKKKTVNLISSIAIGTVSITFLFFYDPFISYKIYTGIVENSIFEEWVYTVDIFYYMWMIFSLLYPLYGFKTNVYGAKSPLRKKQFLGVTVCVMLLNIVFFIIYNLGVFRRVYFINGVSAILPSASSYQVNPRIYMYAMIFMILVTIVEFVIIQRYELTKNVGRMNRFVLKKNVSGINENLINVFHTFKNIVFTYQILIRKARAEQGEEKEKTLEELDNQISEYINRLSKMLDINNEIDVTTDSISANDVIDEALATVKIPDNIEVIKKYNNDVRMIADSFYMVEALSNIIKNAVEAIQKKNKTGIIVLKSDVDGEWVVIEIADNGIGMKKRDIVKIFKPFYTTKSRISNWGIGLSYTSKIIKQHKGCIVIESNENVGTTFYIHLPRG